MIEVAGTLSFTCDCCGTGATMSFTSLQTIANEKIGTFLLNAVPPEWSWYEEIWKGPDGEESFIYKCFCNKCKDQFTEVEIHE